MVPLFSVVMKQLFKLSFATVSLVILANNALTQDDTELKYLEVKVIDPNGQPMTDIEVEISIDGAEFPMEVDDEGILGFNIPEQGTRLVLKVRHPGYLFQGARWNEEDKIPDDFTIPMKKGIKIGGVVQDEDANPIAGRLCRRFRFIITITEEAPKGKASSAQCSMARSPSPMPRDVGNSQALPN